jgi:hypothetical protein
MSTEQPQARQTADIEISLAAGALMAIEAVLRDRIADAVADDPRRVTVEIPLVAAMVLAEFAEASRRRLECISPVAENFGVRVAEIVQTIDVQEPADVLIGALAATSEQLSAHSAKRALSWFVCELVRVITCTMPLPPGTSDSRSRLDFFGKHSGHWPCMVRDTR